MQARHLAASLIWLVFLNFGVANIDEALESNPAAWAENDECDAEGSSCALNALQRKSASIMNATIEGPSDDASDTANPVYSDSLPDYSDTVPPASTEMTLGNGYLRHYAQTCWHQCGSQYGRCDHYCGYGNSCCRYPGTNQPPECANHASVHWWPVRSWSTCVTSHVLGSTTTTTTAPPAPITDTTTKTLYQMTSPQAAKDIIDGNFRPGTTGWCGGAIYFIDHPHLKKSKYNPRTTRTGAYVQAEVEMGKLCRMSRTCNNGASGKCCTYKPTGGHSTQGAQNAGCNSIVWNPGDGDEYIIWHPEQVKSKKLYKCTHSDCQSLFPDLQFGQDGIVQN